MSADWLPATTRSRIMRSIRSKDTTPEQIVRKALFSCGFRYRLHVKHLPGKPDIVFPGRKKVIFIHGCFWHQHSSSQCKITGMPTSNKKYWEPKLQRNIERDAENIAALKSLGWKVYIVWECWLRSAPDASLTRIKKFLGPPR